MIATSDEMRRQAKNRLIENRYTARLSGTEEDSRLFHELQVHQIELEMQNIELSKARNELEKSLGKYTDLYDFAPVGYFTIDLNGVVLEANLTGAALLGVDRSLLIGRKFEQFIANDAGPPFATFLQKAFESRVKSVCESSLLKEGSLPTIVQIEALAASEGQECRIAVIDITERKRADEYREIVRELLKILNKPGDMQDSIRRVINALHLRTGFDAVGIRLKDGDDFPYFAQKGFPEDFLLKENMLIGRAVTGGVCRDEEGNVSLECTCGLVISGRADPANPLFTRGGSFWTNDSFSLMDIPPDEDPRIDPRNQCIHQGYASVALVPIRNESGIVGLIQFNDRRKGCFTLDTIEHLEGVASHIGEALMRKRAEEKLKILHTELAARAGELETANIELEAFNYTVSHDLRKPLTVINSYCQVIQELCFNRSEEPCKEYIREIFDSTLRMNRLIDTLLNFSRINHTKLRAEKIDLSSIAITVDMELRMAEPYRRVVFRNAPGLTANGDAGLLRVVLDNLIGNAWKYTSLLEEAEIEFGLTEIDGESVWFVRDNGPGFAASDEKKIFIPFHRLTDAEENKGHGIGLATVERIIRRHGGRVWAEGTPGKGARFFFTLPVEGVST